MTSYYEEQLNTQINIAEKGMWIAICEAMTEVSTVAEENQLAADKAQKAKPVFDDLASKFKALDELYSDRKRLQKQLAEWKEKYPDENADK